MYSFIIKNRALKYLICISMSFLIISHVYQILFSGIRANQLSLPVFILILFSVFRENRKLYSISIITMGVLYCVYMEGLALLGPSVLFFIALLYWSSLIPISIISVIIPASILLNYLMNGGNVINMIEGILGNYAILLFLYFAVIRQPSKIDHLSKVTPLDKRQLLIMKYLSLDIPRKQIPDRVPEKELWKHDIDNFTLDIVNSEIAKMKKILDIKSEFSLGVWYTKKIEIPE